MTFPFDAAGSTADLENCPAGPVLIVVRPDGDDRPISSLIVVKRDAAHW